MRYLCLLLLCWSVAAMSAPPRIVIDTSLGKFVVELDPDKAPLTVQNFLTYVDSGAYAGTIFHRVIPGFMVQGGGHLPTMAEQQGNGMITNEADNGLRNETGTIAMARMNEIDSASRQFFINVANNAFLDHTADSCTREQQAAAAEARSRGLNKPLSCKSFGYAVFGRVVEGMDVVQKIEGVDTGVFQGYRDVPQAPVVINSVKRVGAVSE